MAGEPDDADGGGGPGGRGAGDAAHWLGDEVVPRLRGLLHLYAFWLALVAAGALVALAPAGEARLAAAIYGAGLCALFAASGLYHRWPGHPRWRPLLRRIDHGAIFVFIAASYVPVALVALGPPLGTVVLASVGGGAAAGVLLRILWPAAPRALTSACYLAVGWVSLVALPAMLRTVGVTATLLFLAGGALYSAGAVVYTARRPNPWPRTFGFHEVFHALVIAAAVTHFVAIAGWVLPRAGSG